MTTEERFWAKVSKDPDGCWRWTASKVWSGYGQFSVGSRVDGTRRLVSAHRYSYELAHGPIPDGLVIDHTCRVRCCVNPEHLRATTQRDNVMAKHSQSITAKQSRQTHCKHGHEFTPENTYRLSNGGRRCRTCHTEQGKLRRELKADD